MLFTRLKTINSSQKKKPDQYHGISPMEYHFNSITKNPMPIKALDLKPIPRPF